MATDIVPGLLELIQKDFRRSINNNTAITRVQKLVEAGTATYKEANDLAVWTGQLLSASIKRNITSDILPDGKMYYNIADRVLGEMLKEDYDLVSTAAEQIQTSMNRKAGIGLKAKKPKFNQNRVDGLVDRLSSEEFEKVEWLLDEPIVNFSQNVVDEFIKENFEFQGKSGLSAKVVRTPESGACEWCKEVAGEYIYPDVPEDVWRRHERCKCVIDYTPRKGRTERLSGSGKSWV